LGNQYWIVFSPIGFIIGLFVGAFIGKLIYTSKEKKCLTRCFWRLRWIFNFYFYGVYGMLVFLDFVCGFVFQTF
jgi:hypothetical protein